MAKWFTNKVDWASGKMSNMFSANPAQVERFTSLTWFEGLFGFNERDGIVDVAKNFHFDPSTGILKSHVNGRQLQAGYFTTPSLGDLKKQALKQGIIDEQGHYTQTRIGSRDRLEIKHMVVNDVFSLHADKKYRGATFMAASQFNCLEFPHYSVTPEKGVTNYANDPTQGPACALAAPAATVVRNYFVKVNGEIGQSKNCQINNLEGMLTALRNNATDAKKDELLVNVRNGYTFASSDDLQLLNERIKNTRHSAPGAHSALLEQLRVGRHMCVGAPFSTERFSLVPTEEHNYVSQVFCSAISCGYSHAPLHEWEPLARLVLEASYEATLLAAALEAKSVSSNDSMTPTGSGQVLLTFIGGGVFANESEWIESAILRACKLMRHVGIEVIICHYRQIDQDLVERFDLEIEEMEQDNIHYMKQVKQKHENNDTVPAAQHETNGASASVE